VTSYVNKNLISGLTLSKLAVVALYVIHYLKTRLSSHFIVLLGYDATAISEGLK